MPIQFRLLRIDVPQFAILTNEAINGPFGINYEINFALGDKHIIKCVMKIVYMKDSSPITQLMVEAFFAVEDSSWKEFEKEDSIVVPAGFLQHMAALTLGTARGIQYAKTMGIGINNYMIPLTNLTEIITKDLVIRKQ